MAATYYMLDFGHNGRSDGGKIGTRDAAAMRCGRYNSLDRAMRDLAASAGTPGRFGLLDRSTMTVIAESGQS